MAEASAPVSHAMITALAPSPDAVVLELAGGTGELVEALAPRVGRYIHTDFSPAMVETAKRRGIPGVEHRVMDMQAIDLPDATVDGVLCRYGYWEDYRGIMTSLAASPSQTLAGLDDSTRAEVDEAARTRFELFATGSNYVLPARALVARLS